MTNEQSLKPLINVAKLIFVFLIWLIATNCFGQVVNIPKAGNWQFVDSTGTIPPPCQTCPPGEKGDKGDNGRGIVSTVVDPTTGIMTVTYTDGTKYISSSLTGPKGKDGTDGNNGTCPNCPPSGGGTSSQVKQYWVTDYGAKSDGITDDTQAFQNAANAAIQNRGKLVIPAPNNFYKLTNTINFKPAAGTGQTRILVDAWGWGGQGTNAIRYMGASNKAVFYLVGIKTNKWVGLTVGIADGLSGVTIFDIDTEGSATSSAGSSFDTFYLDLGNGNNNVAFRTGHNRSQTGDDISNLLYQNCSIYGQKKSGQIAFLNEGPNTLHLQMINTFVAFCDKMYANQATSGSSRGNGSVYAVGAGTSQNNIDWDINHEQTYSIIGGRNEGGKIFMRVPNFAQVSPNIIVQNVTIGDYSDSDGLFQINVPANITLENVYMNQTDHGGYTNPVTINCSSGVGSLVMINCSISTTNTNCFNKTGGSWQVTTFGNTRMSLSSVVTNAGHFPAEFAQMK